MKVIPVIDLRRGIVVHARLGRRAEYQPLQSRLCRGCDPIEVAQAFEQLGFRELYVADLDAIMERKPDLRLYGGMTRGRRLSLMVDAGIDSPAAAMPLLDSGVSRVIIGTETLTSPDLVVSLVRHLGNRVVISLDLMNRQLLSKSQELVQMQAVDAALYFQECGVIEAIVLDLARVGSNLGPDFELVREIHDRTELSVLVGGGVRDLQDLERLRALGADGALVATALHSGAITPDQLRATGFL